MPFSISRAASHASARSRNARAFACLTTRRVGGTAALPKAQLVVAAEIAPDEHVEGQAGALLVGSVEVGGVHDHRGKQADVVGLGPVSPCLAVVDVERI